MIKTKETILIFLLLIAFSFSLSARNPRVGKDPLALSSQLLMDVYAGKETQKIQESLASISLDELASKLTNDQAKKAFWINVYNSYVIIFLKNDPTLYEDRGSFFSKKRITIANNSFSFDDIEHGIVRKSRVKLGLGILPNLFPGKLERKLRVNKIDPRVHFALNCGAESCPPVRFFEASEIEKQLDLASKSYLKEIVTYSAEEDLVSTTPLMSWFRGDFGGKKGTTKFLKKYRIIPEDSRPNIKFQSYSWEIDVDNFVE